MHYEAEISYEVNAFYEKTARHDDLQVKIKRMKEVSCRVSGTTVAHYRMTKSCCGKRRRVIRCPYAAKIGGDSNRSRRLRMADGFVFRLLAHYLDCACYFSAF